MAKKTQLYSMQAALPRASGHKLTWTNQYLEESEEAPSPLRKKCKDRRSISGKLVTIGRSSGLLGEGLAKKQSYKTSLAVNEGPVLIPTASKNEQWTGKQCSSNEAGSMSMQSFKIVNQDLGHEDLNTHRNHSPRRLASEPGDLSERNLITDRDIRLEFSEGVRLEKKDLEGSQDSSPMIDGWHNVPRNNMNNGGTKMDWNKSEFSFK